MATKLFPMLSCADLEESRRFYAGLLGGEENYRFPEHGPPQFLTLTVGVSEIGLGVLAGRPVHGRAQRPATGHRVELCVYVENVDAVFREAGNQGFEAVMEPGDTPWGERTAWLADPDGNLVMLTG